MAGAVVGHSGTIVLAVGMAGIAVTLTPAEISAFVKDEGEAKIGSTSAADGAGDHTAGSAPLDRTAPV